MTDTRESQDFSMDRIGKREVRLLASRDPWLLWRLQALRAGYVPPLIPGHIPPDMAGGFIERPRGGERPYNIEPLVQQAREERGRIRGLIPRFLLAVMIAVLTMAGAAAFLSTLDGAKFKINLIHALLPRYEEHMDLWL